MAATISPINNWPYAAIPNVAAVSGGPCVSRDCTGAVITIVGGLSLTGPYCTAADLNNFNAGGSPFFTLSSTTGSITLGNTPVSLACTPGVPPIITLATNTLQSPITAAAVASISGGVVTSITVTNPGRGYVAGASNTPTVTIGSSGA